MEGSCCQIKTLKKSFGAMWNSLGVICGFSKEQTYCILPGINWPERDRRDCDWGEQIKKHSSLLLLKVHLVYNYATNKQMILLLTEDYTCTCIDSFILLGQVQCNAPLRTHIDCIPFPTKLMFQAGCFIELVSVFSPWLPLRRQQQLELKRGRDL